MKKACRRPPFAAYAALFVSPLQNCDVRCRPNGTIVNHLQSEGIVCSLRHAIAVQMLAQVVSYLHSFAPAGTPDPDIRDVDRIRRLGGPLLVAACAGSLASAATGIGHSECILACIELSWRCCSVAPIELSPISTCSDIM